MRVKTNRIPKSAKQLSERTRVKTNRIPKSAKQLSERMRVKQTDRNGNPAVARERVPFRLSLVFLSRFQFGNEISLTDPPLSSLVKNKLITRPAKGRSTGTLFKWEIAHAFYHFCDSRHDGALRGDNDTGHGRAME